MKDIPVRKITSQQNSSFSQAFSIRDVRDLLVGKDMIQELHRHNFFYLLILKKGKGNHTIDFTSYQISDHSVFFIRPGQVHELTLKAASTGFLIKFNNDLYHPHDKDSNQLLRKASSMNLYHLDVTRFRKLLSIIKVIFQEYHDKYERYEEVIKANLGVFFIELVRQHTAYTSLTIKPYTQQRLDEFLALLEIHFAIHKQASFYADKLNLSAFQLNAITKATLGKTCSELINDYIILESKRYLLATSNQINQIADHLGYEDVSYFIRFFKKHTGSSPEAFRHNFR